MQHSYERWEAKTRKSVVSGLLPAARSAPYSHAIVAGGFVFSSGTAGIHPATGTVRDGIEAQTEQALRTLRPWAGGLTRTGLPY